MTFLKQCIFIITTVGLFYSASVSATLLTWDFTIMVDRVYRDDANVIDDNIIDGSILQGSFSYDSGLLEDSPTNDYVDRYADPSGSFTVTGLGLYDWSVSASVVHQSSRDIVDVEGDFRSGNISESIEIGFLDDSQSYNNSVLPINWHTPPVSFTDIEFDYTLNLGTNPCCYDSWLSGHVTSITLRAPQQVPEPSSLLLLAFAFAMTTVARKSKYSK